MKTLFLTIALLTLTTASVFAQEFRIDSSVRYTKTIEPNRLDTSDSVSGKTGLDRRFFGDFNARVEYLLEPSFSPTLGLRIYKMPGDTSFVLEAKRVSNYQEVNEQLRKEFPLIGISINDISSISQEESNRIMAHNRDMMAKTFAERLKRYAIEVKSTPIHDSLANKLYDKATKLLRAALPVGKSPYTIFDGETATFRCVVNDNELWTLRYHVPEGEYKALSDLFRQMIADVEAGCFEEGKYIQSL